MPGDEKKVNVAAKKRPADWTDETVVVEQYRSAIRRPGVQRLQLKSLGLGRVGKTKILPKIPSVMKLVERLSHMVRVKE